MADMNVVPLIDILLVLLIIFMIITPLIPRGLDAALPQAADKPGPVAVVVQVGAGGSVRINEENASWDTIGPRLTEIFKSRAEKVAFVRGDDPVEFAEIARAISIMRAAGIEKVGLLTVRMEVGR